MHRFLRRLHTREPAGASLFDPAWAELERARRAVTARGVRGRIRRMEPVVLHTPRWSCPQAFLEEVAMELAVGDPPVGCRTVGLHPLKGASPARGREFLLDLVGQLGHGGRERDIPRAWISVGMDRRTFQALLLDRLGEAQSRSPWPVALLAHGAENLPLELAEDLFQVWSDFLQQNPTNRRAALLVAGPREAASLGLSEGQRLELEDYGEGEATALLTRLPGLAPSPKLQRVVGLTGGIPALVEEMARHLCGEASGMPTLEEMRGALDIAAAHEPLARRLDALLPGRPLEYEPSLDDPLLCSGLLRHQRGSGAVALRAPAIASLVV